MTTVKARRPESIGSSRQGWELELTLGDGRRWVRYLRANPMGEDGLRLKHLETALAELMEYDEFFRKATIYGLRGAKGGGELVLVVFNQQVIGASHRDQDELPRNSLSDIRDFLNYLGDVVGHDPLLHAEGVIYQNGRFHLLDELIEHRHAGVYDYYVMPSSDISMPQMKEIIVKRGGETIVRAMLEEGKIDTLRDIQAGRDRVIEALNRIEMPALYPVIEIESGDPPIAYKDGRYAEVT